MITTIQGMMKINEVIKDKIITIKMVIIQEIIAIKSMVTTEIIKETEKIENY